MKGSKTGCLAGVAGNGVRCGCGACSGVCDDGIDEDAEICEACADPFDDDDDASGLTAEPLVKGWVANGSNDAGTIADIVNRSFEGVGYERGAEGIWIGH